MHAVNWFEIPTLDLDRATAFYEKVFSVSLRREIFFGVPNAIFPGEPGEVRGALVKHDKLAPATTGSVVYLHAGDLDACLARAKEAGGTIAMPKTSLGPIGFIAMVDDTEGNRVGLHMPA